MSGDKSGNPPIHFNFMPPPEVPHKYPTPMPYLIPSPRKEKGKIQCVPQSLPEAPSILQSPIFAPPNYKNQNNSLIRRRSDSPPVKSTKKFRTQPFQMEGSEEEDYFHHRSGIRNLNSLFDEDDPSSQLLPTSQRFRSKSYSTSMHQENEMKLTDLEPLSNPSDPTSVDPDVRNPSDPTSVDNCLHNPSDPASLDSGFLHTSLQISSLNGYNGTGTLKDSSTPVKLSLPKPEEEGFDHSFTPSNHRMPLSPQCPSSAMRRMTIDMVDEKFRPYQSLPNNPLTPVVNFHQGFPYTCQKSNTNPFLREKKCATTFFQRTHTLSRVNSCSFEESNAILAELQKQNSTTTSSPDEKKSLKSSGPLSLYFHQFEELESVGCGSFGEVFKCRHRTDGCIYAVKRSLRKVRGKHQRSNILKEVFGLSAIEDTRHILRYYNAWEEEQRIYIQTEFCEGGTVWQKMLDGFKFTEPMILEYLFQLCKGISHIHSMDLVHLDIKHENIYITTDVFGSTVYKIGDLGLMHAAHETTIYMEGDSRYLSRELINDDMSSLPKSDIFSLGVGIYELCLGRPLPSCGDEWIAIRDGHLQHPESFSQELFDLIKQMCHVDPHLRPEAAEILRYDIILKHKEHRKRERAQLIKGGISPLSLPKSPTNLPLINFSPPDIIIGSK